MLESLTNEQILLAANAAVFGLYLAFDIAVSVVFCYVYRVAFSFLRTFAETNNRETHAVLWATGITIWIIYNCRLFE